MDASPKASYRIHRGNPENDGPDVDPADGFAGGKTGFYVFLGVTLLCGAALAIGNAIASFIRLPASILSRRRT